MKNLTRAIIMNIIITGSSGAGFGG